MCGMGSLEAPNQVVENHASSNRRCYIPVLPAAGRVSSSFQSASQPNAPNLTEVALHHNLLSGNFLSPSQLNLFTSLEVLDLSHNDLTQVRHNLSNVANVLAWHVTA